MEPFDYSKNVKRFKEQVLDKLPKDFVLRRGSYQTCILGAVGTSLGHPYNYNDGGPVVLKNNIASALNLPGVGYTELQALEDGFEGAHRDVCTCSGCSGTSTSWFYGLGRAIGQKFGA